MILYQFVSMQLSNLDWNLNRKPAIYTDECTMLFSIKYEQHKGKYQKEEKACMTVKKGRDKKLVTVTILNFTTDALTPKDEQK